MRLKSLPLIAAVMVLACAPAARADCTGPAEVASTVIYNKDHQVLQYCDNTNWIPVGRSTPGSSISSGLVAWWKFDESSGSAADSSGNGYTASLVSSPVYYPSGGQLDGALETNGTSSYAEAAIITQLASATQATLTAWLYRSSSSVSVSLGQHVANHRFNMGWGNDDKFYVTAEDGTGSSYPWFALTGTGWHHFAMVYDGTKSGINRITAYLDGQPQTLTLPGGSYEPAATLTSSPNQSTFRVGSDKLGNFRYFGGRYDDVRVYNRALSGDEVRQLYAYCTTCACSSPAGTQGTILYNAVHRTPQYCNGAYWQNFGRTTTAWGVTFDGTNDYLTRGADLTGSADVKTVTGSFWFRRNGGNGNTQVFYCTLNSAGSCRFQVNLNTNNQIQLFGTGTGGGSTILNLRGGTAITDTNWHHVAFSVDMADAAKRFIYLDGAAETLTVTTYTNAVIDFTRTDHSVGAFTDGNSKFNGDLADFYLDIGTYTDLSVANKRELFRDSAGNAVNLGTDGSIPTGYAQEVFLSDSVLSTWPTNKGSGGGFTENGALGKSTTEPGRACLNNPLGTLAGSYDTPGNASGVWGDGTYVYVADGFYGVKAFTFNGSSFTLAGSYDTTGTVFDVWGDGTYIYVADGAGGVLAFTFNGTTFTPVGSYASGAESVWGDGTYIYVAGDTMGVKAFTFNGSSFTLAGSYDTPGNAKHVWGDGTYIYVADYNSGVQAYTFSGSAFTLAGSYDTPGIVQSVWGDGTYIYVADFGDGIKAFTFNGSAFTLVSSQDTEGNARGIWGDNTYIYVADMVSGIKAFTFNGSSFALVDRYDTAGLATIIWGDGTYVYLTDYASGIKAFSATSCSCSSPPAKEGTILYNGDHNVLQYCDGVNWKGVGK